jgi:glycine dehydrogenase subunit 1
VKSPYIPNTEDDRKEMLESLGLSSVSDLFTTLPDAVRLNSDLDVPGPLSEFELRRHALGIAGRNGDLQSYACFLGAGIYDHYIPATVPAITGRSEFYTSYTPYQPEISQGNLQVIFEFQTMVCRLTGMDVANASMYDGASALAEAALMANSITGRTKWLVSRAVHPSYRDTMWTYAWAAGFAVEELALSGITTDIGDLEARMSDDVSCVVVQYPNFFGTVEDLARIEQIAHEHGALFTISCDPICLGILKPPGEINADICVAEGQSLGIAPGFGGPLLGLMACKKEYVRQLPGRLVGATVDAQGRRSYTLTLQTREQHIRREKATSNICTNQALNALAATVYMATLGPQGLRHVAELCFDKAHYAAERIAGLDGFAAPFGERFVKECVIRCNRPVQEINTRLIEKGIIGGLDLSRFYPELAGHMLLCVTEKRTKDEIDRLVECLAK